MSSAPAGSVAERLSRLVQNPVARKAALTGLIGAGGGALAGSYETGSDAKSEGMRGALVGGALGTGIGLIGPALRAGDARKAFNASVKASEEFLDSAKKVNDTAQSLLKFKNNRGLKQAVNDASKVDTYQKSIKKLTSLYNAGKQNTPEAIQLAQDITSSMPELNRMGVTTLAEAQNKSKALAAQIASIKQKNIDIEETHRHGGMALNWAGKALDYRKKRGVQYNLNALSKSDIAETLAVPSLAALVSAGLGFGLAEDAREQQLYRKAKEGK